MMAKWRWPPSLKNTNFYPRVEAAAPGHPVTLTFHSLDFPTLHFSLHFSRFAPSDKVPLRGLREFSLLSRCAQIAGLLLFAVVSGQNASAQHPSSNPPQTPATPIQHEISVVNSVQVVHDRGVPALEVLSTLPSVPQIQFLDSPPRLVVDLLHARIGLKEKHIEVAKDNILGIRAEQFQDDPPIVRIVLDLRAAYSYTWDEAGNRLMVRLKPPEDVTASKKRTPVPPGARSLIPSKPAAITPISGGGPNVVDESRLVSGSSLTAGTETAVLRLSRGGEVRICPRTTVSVTLSKNDNELMLGMSTGGLEMHYSLKAFADTVLTPDFRVLFAGPGEFDFAVSADSHGNTCVRGLTGNTSSAIVSELIGDRTYQVRPEEQAVFRGGQIDKVDSNVPLECGCPAPVPVLLAEAPAATDSQPATNFTLSPTKAAPESANKPGQGAGNLAATTQTLSNGPETRPLPPEPANSVHVQVEAPFVFRGKKNSAPPPPTEEAAALPVLESRPAPAEIQVQAPLPPPKTVPRSSGPSRFLRRLKGIFSALFS